MTQSRYTEWGQPAYTGTDQRGDAMKRWGILLIVCVAVVSASVLGAWLDPLGAFHPRTARVPVLTYHHLADQSDGSVTVSADLFDEQMRALYEAGCTPVLPRDLYEYVYKGKKLPRNPVMITFDDGYLSNFDIAFLLLKKYDFRATIFVIGVTFGKDTYKDGRTPITPHFGEEPAREMLASGLVSIQSHSFDMHQFAPYDENPRSGILRRDGEGEQDYIHALRDDCEKEADLIRCVTGLDVLAFAYPFGYHDASSAELLREMGIKMTFTTEPGQNTLIQGEPSSLMDMRRYTIDGSVSPEALLRIVEGALEKGA